MFHKAEFLEKFKSVKNLKFRTIKSMNIICIYCLQVNRVQQTLLHRKYGEKQSFCVVLFLARSRWNQIDPKTTQKDKQKELR